LCDTGADGDEFGAHIALDLSEFNVGEERVAVGVRHLLDQRERTAETIRQVVERVYQPRSAGDVGGRTGLAEAAAVLTLPRPDARGDHLS